MDKLRHTSLLRLCLPLFLACLAPLPARAQADAQFSQYFEVPNYYNAAAIGVGDMLHTRAAARLQWVGIKHAPQTFLVTGDMPFRLFRKRLGVGLLFQQESYGLYHNLNIGAQLAYKQPLFKGVLSLGLQLGLIDQQFRGSHVLLPDDDDYHQGSDDAIPTTDIRGNALDIGLGIFYTHRWFWAGISAQHLNSPTVALNAETGDGGQERNYEFQIGRTFYFIAGSNIKVKNTLFEVLPSFLVKTDMTFTSWDATCRLRYNNFLTAGLGYRWKDAVYLVLSAQFKGFYLGYSYDYSTSAIAKASSGSHEIFIGYNIKLDLGDRNRHRHRSVRIM